MIDVVKRIQSSDIGLKGSLSFLNKWKYFSYGIGPAATSSYVFNANGFT